MAKKFEKKYPSYDFKSFKIIHHMILENLYRTNLTYSFNTEKLNQMKQTQTKHKVLTIIIIEFHIAQSVIKSALYDLTVLLLLTTES